MVSKAPFTICRIKNKENFSFYVMYRDPSTGKRGTKKSLDKLKQNLNLGFNKVTRREEAILIAQKALEEGLIFNTTKDLGFRAYLVNFFNFEESPYFQRKLMLDNASVSQDYVSTRRNLIYNHVLPLIDRSLKTSQVSITYLEEIQTSLVKRDNLSNTTINQIMGSITLALNYAKKIGLIKTTEIVKVENLKSDIKTRGILTQDETNKVMEYLEQSKDKRGYLSCYLAIVTGMRSGEIRALKRDNIDNGLIHIEHTYANLAGYKIPKGKKSRVVPCPQNLIDELISFSFTNKYPSADKGIIFFSARGGNIVSSHYFSTKFKEALIKSNTLTEEQIKKRNITFHSLRHMANTLLRGEVDEYILRLAIGHSSEQLSDIYSHIEDNALNSIRVAQEKNILPFIKKKC